MTRVLSDLDKKLMKQLKDSGLDAQDACGVFIFLNRKDEYKHQMNEFLKIQKTEITNQL